MWKPSARLSTATGRPPVACLTCNRIPTSPSSSIGPLGRQRRCFHEYFVTHIPSSSLHPDSGPRLSHKLPRDKSTPHETKGDSRSPAAVVGANRDMTVVRIPLKSAKHHFGVSLSRGSRPYNEDAFQAGTIEVPAFAKRRPMSLTRKSGAANEVTPADSASGDPQVFYFGVFDGHGGAVCSGFLREQLHDYLEKAMKQFELQSSLKGWPLATWQCAGSEHNTKEPTYKRQGEPRSHPDTHAARHREDAATKRGPSGRFAVQVARWINTWRPTHSTVR